jgi:hypothetical protein
MYNNNGVSVYMMEEHDNMLIELSNCVSRLTTLQEQMEKTILTMNERISDIEQKPSNILTVIITAVITAGITTLFSLLVR